MSLDVVVCTVELDQPIEVVGNTADYSFSGIGSGIESFTCKLDGVELQDCMYKINTLETVTQICVFAKLCRSNFWYTDKSCSRAPPIPSCS